MAQGTVTRRIESAAQDEEATRSSHHNVGGLPETLNLSARTLLGVQRRSARAAGLTAARNGSPTPPPAPAGVRILGEGRARGSSAAPTHLHRRITNTTPATGRWYDLTAQAFAAMKSVGVRDGRTYENVVALRAVQTTDFMTAHWAELPHSLLAKVSNRIINEVRGFNRVVYDISGKPPATIEWE